MSPSTISKIHLSTNESNELYTVFNNAMDSL